MSDGSVTFSTELDNEKLEKELLQLNKKIDSLNEKIYGKQQERLPILEQSKQLGAELDAAKAKLDHMQSGVEFFPKTQVEQQAGTVKQLQKEWDMIERKADGYSASVARATVELDRSKEKAGGIAQQLSAAHNNASMMGPAIDHAGKYLDRFTQRVKNLARRVLVFSVITMALRSMRDWFGKIIKTNDEATTAMAKLKGALLVLAQPLVDVIIPAFTVLVNVLANIVSMLAKVMAALFGTTIDQSKKAAESLYDETEAIEDTGAAAKKAGKSLAAFDEINQLSSNGDAVGGGSSAETEEIKPDFNMDTGAFELAMSRILNLVKLVGTALLYWKLPKELHGGLKTFIGLLLLIEGAIRFIKNFFDAWNNGLNWENIKEMLIGMAVLALGLGIALGPVAAGISLIVTGLALLVLGFKDAFENGWTLQNLLVSIGGILALGLGIALFTGSWIPLLLAAIAAILLAVTVAMGHGKELLDGLKTMLRGFIDFFAGIFTGDIDRAIKGIGEIFGGLKQAIFAVFDSLIEGLGPKFSNTITLLKDLIGGAIDFCKEVLTGLTQFLTGVFTGDWDMAWKGILNTLIGIVNAGVSAIEAFVNWIIRAINNAIDGMNEMVSVAGSLLGFSWQIPSIDVISLGRIPMLATGAVIPPNREFMAVLGDQKSGNNYEVPDAKLRQLIREESAASRGATEVKINFAGSLAQLARVLQPEITVESKRRGTSLVTGG